MNLGTKLRGRPRNRWQVEVREDGQIVGGEGWQEKLHNREEWKKLLGTARNRHILHMPRSGSFCNTPSYNPKILLRCDIHCLNSGFLDIILNKFIFQC